MKIRSHNVYWSIPNKNKNEERKSSSKVKIGKRCRSARFHFFQMKKSTTTTTKYPIIHTSSQTDSIYLVQEHNKEIGKKLQPFRKSDVLDNTFFLMNDERWWMISDEPIRIDKKHTNKHTPTFVFYRWWKSTELPPPLYSFLAWGGSTTFPNQTTTNKRQNDDNNNNNNNNNNKTILRIINSSYYTVIVTNTSPLLHSTTEIDQSDVLLIVFFFWRVCIHSIIYEGLLSYYPFFVVGMIESPRYKCELF